MKKLLSASVALAMMATPVFAADVKLGIILVTQALSNH